MSGFRMLLAAICLMAAASQVWAGEPGPVYLIAEVKVLDSELYARYAERVPALVARFGGRYLVRGGQVTPMAGGWRPERIIVMQFESAEALRRCFASPEYQEILPLRERSTQSRAIVVEGCAPGASEYQNSFKTVKKNYFQ